MIGIIGSILSTGVHIERFHAIQLSVSSINNIEATDWDLKQSFRKLDQHCSTPLCEKIVRNSNRKLLILSLVFENEMAVEKLTDKIKLLRNELMVNKNHLQVKAITKDKTVSDSEKERKNQSIWLRNLPSRWFDLDSFHGNRVIPSNHMLRKLLEEQFGLVLQMECKNQITNLLQCDVCVGFATLYGSDQAMTTFGGDSCVAKKEGASAIFLISAELDDSGYLEKDSIAERALSRDELHAAQSTQG
jgi:hypothetical protein